MNNSNRQSQTSPFCEKEQLPLDKVDAWLKATYSKL
jgi:hypothetical protein